MCQPGVTHSRSTCIKATTRGCNKLQWDKAVCLVSALDGVLCRSVASAGLWSGPFLCGCLWGGAGVGAASTKLRPTFPPRQSATQPTQPSPGRQKSLNYWVSAPPSPAQPGQHPPPPLKPVADWIMAPLTIFIPDIYRIALLWIQTLYYCFV